MQTEPVTTVTSVVTSSRQPVPRRKITAPLVNNRPAKLLVISSAVDSSSTLIEQLKQAGFQVCWHDKKIANTLVLIMSQQPDLILLDVEPILNDEPMLCRLIKRNRLINQTPILLYSSLEKRTLNRQLAECQATGYLQKSWRSGHLIKKIAQFLPIA